MLENIKRLIRATIEKYKNGYILVAMVFCAGVALSIVLRIPQITTQEIKIYINDFIKNVDNYNVSANETFKIAVISGAQSLLMTFLFSLTFFGSIAIVGSVFIKGFYYGTIIIAAFSVLQEKGFAFFVSSILPHSVVLFPCIWCYSVFCIYNSKQISKGVKSFKAQVFQPFIYGVLGMFFVTFSATVQAYIEPFLIRVAF